MQFDETQKKEITDLMAKGFSQGLAETVTAAKAAGYSQAHDVGHGIVRVLTGQEKGASVDVAAERKRLQDQLAAVSGKPDHLSLQTAIGLRRKLAELNRA